MKHKLEYIWLDGGEPTSQLRSKTKIVSNFVNESRSNVLSKTSYGEAPIWGFDGSSTNQAEGHNSDCVLQPVRVYRNPLEPASSIVLCEVWNVDYTPHETNTRNKLVELLESLSEDPEEWVGFEQEYTLYDLDTSKPLGWPKDGEPPPQGDYYCGRNAGEDIITEHTNACIEADISICGTNAEVMLGQWEYQIGAGASLKMSDDLWIARWLMEKICDGHNASVSLDPKPIEGDWNGAGCHTNFSTKWMRNGVSGWYRGKRLTAKNVSGDKNWSSVDGETWDGLEEIEKHISKLEKNHEEHMAVYGEGNERRLTGLHETQAIDTFSWGVSDRGASIRIPWQVEKDGCGYLEDRRPSANCDPYEVSYKLVETICK
jgi:glutamine synthetase